MDPFARTDIVIIGGGFGGMNAAMALDLRLRRGLKIEVTLISRSNFFSLPLCSRRSRPPSWSLDTP